MTTPDILATALPFAIAFALTHLIVLPLKAFFISGDLRFIAMRATTWNLLALVYTATIAFLFGVESGTLFLGAIKFLPGFLAFAYSIGVWLYVMVRANWRFMLIDVAIFTILALAAS